MSGDRILLVSDGGFNTLGDSAIIAHLDQEPQAAVEAIVWAVEDRKVPGQDNATIVIVGVNSERRRVHMKMTKRYLSWVCLALALMLALAPAAMAADNYEKARDSIVRIYTTTNVDVYLYGNYEGTITMVGKGTGVAVGKKDALVNAFVTCRHVVVPNADEILQELKTNEFSALPEDAVQITVAEPDVNIVFEDLSSMVPVRRTVVSDKYDLACLYIATATDKRKPATFGLYSTADHSLIDKPVMAFGFDGLSDFVQSGEALPKSLPSYPRDATPTHGNILHVAENDLFGSIVQHSAEINGGNSGGPLVWPNGMVIGINTSGKSEGVNESSIAQTTRQLQQFLTSENIDAEFAEITGVPIATIAIIAAAVLLIVAIVVFGVVSGKKKSPVAVVDPQGTRSLVVSSGSLRKDSNYSLIPGKVFLIGTDGTKCNLVYPKGTPGVSRVHCSVTFDGRTVMVKDENSSYGVYIDQQKLQNGQPTVLHRGHKLCLGSQKESLTLR